MTNDTTHQIEQIEVIRTALSKKYSWYTGIPIKQYLKKTLFGLKSPHSPQNLNLESGRWSAYCHYSLLQSFKNQLAKYSISNQSTVLVHPLTPTHLIDELMEIGCTIQTLDITIDTLNIDTALLKNHLASSPQIDLVVHYSQNGLYADLIDNVTLTASYSHPSLVIIDNDFITPGFIDLIYSVTLGGMIWLGGDSFFDEMLHNLVPISIETHKWYMSWSIETRTISILEYHLTDSQEKSVPLVEALYQFLSQQVRTQNMVKGVYYNTLAQYVYQIPKRTLEEVQKTISDGYEAIQISAIPDVIFELRMLEPLTNMQKTRSDIDDFSHALTTTSSQIHLALTEQNIEGTSIPKHFQTQAYLQYHFLSDHKESWNTWSVSKSLHITSFNPIHPYLQQQNIPLTKQLIEKGLSIDILRDFSAIKYV
jgi:hypothetical protein